MVELWTIPAERLLATNDLGVIPWIPLSRIDGPIEPILQECRERIDRASPEEERENLLAVTQVLIGLRYNDPKFLAIFGGEGAMIESPVLQSFVAKRVHRAMLDILQIRFGSVPAEIATPLREVIDDEKLAELNKLALI